MNSGLAHADETKILLRTAAGAAADYALATGVDCALLDESGSMISDASPRCQPVDPYPASLRRAEGNTGGVEADSSTTGQSADGAGDGAADSDICLCMRTCRQRNQDCRDLHLYAASQSERFGGSYIYLCPIGMHYWASPVYAGDTVAGILVGGPVRAIDAEEAVLELIERHGSEVPELAIRNCIAAIPAATPERIHALASMLSATAERVSPAIAVSLNERQRFLDQQSHIAAAIHEMKFNNPGSFGEVGYANRWL